jgi:hypothetical protein
MRDIVERAHASLAVLGGNTSIAVLIVEMADEIERLRAQRDELLAALVRIRDWGLLPLTDLTDTDEELAETYRNQLSVHSEIARAAIAKGGGKMSDAPELAKPIWVTTQEGGEYIPWEEWRAEFKLDKGWITLAEYLAKWRIHSVGFDNGWIFDNMVGWRKQ